MSEPSNVEDPPSDNTEIEVPAVVHGQLLPGRRVWSIARHGFRQMLGTGASDVIMYQFWRMYGQAMIKELYPRRAQYAEGSLTELRSLLFRITEANNWGKVGLEIKEAMDELSVDFDNCSFCEASTSERQVCFEMAGLLSGFSETLVGRTCTVSEIKCRAKGDDSCRFLIKFR